MSLVSALVEVRSWSEAERAAEQVAKLEVASARATMLSDAATTARRLRAPQSLQGMLTTLAAR